MFSLLSFSSLSSHGPLAKQRCLEPYDYIAGMPGKNVRSRLIDAFQQWLCIPEEFIAEIKDIVGSLHNASLL